jgi:hypothetical protein
MLSRTVLFSFFLSFFLSRHSAMAAPQGGHFVCAEELCLVPPEQDRFTWNASSASK